ncbi:MAG: ATP-binding protein, partial [Oscillospiraceae bacterium]|nr:ATP-binding protein [Oscillospiraceae bacterium]
MKELSLNILDIAKNSTKAKATLVTIIIDERDGWRTLTIKDDGCGMPPEMVAT